MVDLAVDGQSIKFLFVNILFFLLYINLSVFSQVQSDLIGSKLCAQCIWNQEVQAGII